MSLEYTDSGELVESNSEDIGKKRPFMNFLKGFGNLLQAGVNYKHPGVLPALTGAFNNQSQKNIDDYSTTLMEDYNKRFEIEDVTENSPVITEETDSTEVRPPLEEGQYYGTGGTEILDITKSALKGKKTKANMMTKSALGEFDGIGNMLSYAMNNMRNPNMQYVIPMMNQVRKGLKY